MMRCGGIQWDSYNFAHSNLCTSYGVIQYSIKNQLHFVDFRICFYKVDVFSWNNIKQNLHLEELKDIISVDIKLKNEYEPVTAPCLYPWLSRLLSRISMLFGLLWKYFYLDLNYYRLHLFCWLTMQQIWWWFHDFRQCKLIFQFLHKDLTMYCEAQGLIWRLFSVGQYLFITTHIWFQSSIGVLVILKFRFMSVFKDNNCFHKT